MAVVLTTPVWLVSRGYVETSSNVTMNAVGESLAIIGHLYFPAQTGSKTLSTGVIYINPATASTFADAGSNVRIGIQDVTAATGLEDGIFDVFDDMVGGTDSFVTNALQAITMSSGTKTMTYGDLIAVVIEMTARGGADAVNINRVAVAAPYTNFGFPNGSVDTGTLTKSAIIPAIMIKFDDATYGWIDNVPLLVNYVVGRSTIAFASNSTPDEYIGAFQLAYPTTLTGIGLKPEGIATADTFEMILYSDPFGTPVAERTWAPDPDLIVSGQWLRPTFAVPFSAAANTWYGVALRPTSTNSITWSYYDNGTGFNVLKAGQQFVDVKMAARTDQTGAFVETQTYHVPEFAVGIGGYDDGAGSGGGESAAVF